jgi:putative ABC transport system permease protein
MITLRLGSRRAHGAGVSRLTWPDLIRAGSLGLRSRRVRAGLSALGISIGIAAIVGVLGISQSSESGLLTELGQLGNLIVVQPGSTVSGQQAELPAPAQAMVSRIGPVTSVAEIASLSSVYVYRSPFIPAVQTSGISLTAADPALKAILGASLTRGAFLNNATARYPAVVLGSEAASLLGITSLAHPTQVWIGGHWFTVTGILGPVPAASVLGSQMNAMAFIGFPVAEQYFAFDGHPTQLYVRTDPSQVSAVAAVLPATVNPANRAAVTVTEESGILQAEVLAKGAYNGLFLGLGAVALLVGGVGIANVMVISVLERRSEIGLRRALGATRPHRRPIPRRSHPPGRPRRTGRHRHRHYRHCHLRHQPALARADSPPSPLRRRRRRPRHRRHCRAVPRNPSRPPPTHPGFAHCMTPNLGYVRSRLHTRDLAISSCGSSGSAVRRLNVPPDRCRLALSRRTVASGSSDLIGEFTRVVQRQESSSCWHRGEGGVGERLAQLPPQFGAEERVAFSPEDPHGPGELAEPAGGVAEDARVNTPCELGDVAADLLAGQRLYPVAGQPPVEVAAAERTVCERAVPDLFQPKPRKQARDQRGMAQRLEERREGPRREGAERVTVGQNRRSYPAGVGAEHDLADRAASVVADDGHVAQAERRDEVQHKLGDPARREVRVRVHRPLMSAERERRRVAADALGRETFGYGIPEPGIHENSVHEHDRGA